MGVKNTYYWRIPLLPRDFEVMVAKTPGYDAEHCREIVQNWWRGGWLRGDNLRVSAHLNHILVAEVLVRLFDDLSWMGAYPTKARAPKSKKPKWVLVEIAPEVMEASKRALSEVRKSGWKPVPKLDDFRTNALRGFLIRLYGGDEEKGWTREEYEKIRQQ